MTKQEFMAMSLPYDLQVVNEKNQTLWLGIALKLALTPVYFIFSVVRSAFNNQNYGNI